MVLCSLRYEGETDRMKDFWCDMAKLVARPLGWCEANRQTLEPPHYLANQVNVLEVKQKLKDAISVPPELLSGVRVLNKCLLFTFSVIFKYFYILNLLIRLGQ